MSKDKIPAIVDMWVDKGKVTATTRDCLVSTLLGRFDSDNPQQIPPGKMSEWVRQLEEWQNS